MPRGITPRRPAKSGKQEGLRARPRLPKKDAAPARKPGFPTPKSSKAARGYNPLAAERVSEILNQLDQLYPDVTCALTHKSAWELLVATILSAQSTDVRVN